MRIASNRFDNSKRRRGDDADRQRRLTPAYVLDPVRKLLGGIGLDPCTEPDNPTGADSFYCLPTDGCDQPWIARSVFCDPPYGAARERWVRKCVDVGRNTPVVLLIPSATETKIFQYALAHCNEVFFLTARLMFGNVRENGRHEAASHRSAIFGFGVNVATLSPDIRGTAVALI